MSIIAAKIPRAFIWRRLHSLMGLWFLLFLMEHLLTNSQAALWVGDYGQGFVRMVDLIHNLPYLQVIEVSLLGVPILIHIVLGVKYLFTSKFNSGRSNGTTPSISLPRNRAYSWQRITSWILLFCVIGHVVKFRFLQYPETISMHDNTYYAVKISEDPGLAHLAKHLKFSIHDTAEGQLSKFDLKSGQIIALTDNFGTASLLTVRNTFKYPIYIGIYTIFVLAACFHACNGFWTFLITWGLVLRMAAQRAWVSVAAVLMMILIFFGLAAIWGTYWINLRY